MKIPSILNPRIPRKQKLRASTARRARTLGLPDEMDYEEMAEPNMKLSRALLIVLVLHVVAVAGIVAFNTIKTRENERAPTATETAVPPVAATPAAASLAEASPALPNDVAKVAPSHTLKPAEKTTPAPIRSSVKDSGRTYTVVKGDNPVTIARHLKVSEADLLELNQITDSRHLQINQKLHIPVPSAPSKPKAD